MKRVFRSAKIFIFVLGLCGLGILGVYLHIPLSKELFANSSGTSLKITDRYGIVLRETLSAEGGRNTWLAYEDIPEAVKQAIICAEDKRFWSHSGVDLLALGRAMIQNITARRVVSGASTITQQLIKNRLNYPRTVFGKLQEMAMAIRLEQTLSKPEILAQYLNRVEFSNQAYGIEAAARIYFQKPARHLSLAESVFLVGLIQAPSYFNPYRYFDRALQRQRALLDRMSQTHLIDENRYQIAQREAIRLTPKTVNFRAPHFCELILAKECQSRALAAKVKLWHSSVIRTTLDFYLQQKVEEIVATRIDELKDYHVTNAAVLVLDNRSGDILAYVGSKDFFDETIAGQVDGVMALRQPGSTLKPFTYQLALERSYTPATLIPDIQDYPVAPRSFLPENYDKKFHGPVRLRQALACSYNLPAVRVLEAIGVESLYDRLHAFGFASLHELPSFYGSGLTLGDGEVTLLELTRAYGMLARRGKELRERYVLDEVQGARDRAQGGTRNSQLRNSEPGTQLFSPQATYLITHILSDRQAAVPAFGESTPLELPFLTAVKTGTSKDYRDNWTVGYTADYTVGVWVGNFDGTPMQRVSGISGAAPIYRDIILALYRDHDPPSLLADPPMGIVSARICPLSGQLVGKDCPHAINEWFLKGTEPTEPCQMHQAYWVDSRDELLTDATALSAVKKVFVQFPPLYQTWAREMGYLAPPTQYSPYVAQTASTVSSPFGGRAVKFSYLVEKQDVARSHAPRGNAKAGRSASIAAERQIPRSHAERRNENLTALPFGGRTGEVIQIVHPNDGDVYAIDPILRREFQTVQLSAVVRPAVTQLTWYVDGEHLDSVPAPFQSAWPIAPGTHRIYAEAHDDGKPIRSQEITVYIVE